MDACSFQEYLIPERTYRVLHPMMGTSQTSGSDVLHVRRLSVQMAKTFNCCIWTLEAGEAHILTLLLPISNICKGLASGASLV